MKKITVYTRPNGYQLIVDGEQYFYFTVEELLHGLNAHAVEGLKKPIHYDQIPESAIVRYCSLDDKIIRSRHR